MQFTSPAKNNHSFVQTHKRMKNHREHYPITTKYNMNKIRHKETIKKNHYNKNNVIDMSNCDIFYVDSKIKEILNDSDHILESYKKRLNENFGVIVSNKDPMHVIISKREIVDLRKKIIDIENHFNIWSYMFRTHDLLEKYNEMKKETGAYSFMSTPISTKDEMKINDIVSHFISIAKDYVTITGYKGNIKYLACPQCGTRDLQQNIDDEYIYFCETCGIEIESINESPSFKDTERVNMSSKYTYTREGHFSDAIKRFQGTQNTDPGKINKAVDVLKEQITIHGLTEEQGKSNSVTKEHIHMFLSEQGLKDHYNDLNLLFHIITKKSCPDISMYEDTLYKDFETQEKVLKEVIAEFRVNTLNVNYKLYKLLQHGGFPCRKDYFHILKLKTKRDEHDSILKIVWNRLGWEWIPSTDLY